MVVMPKVDPIRVFDVPSESRPGKTYRVQYDGKRWYCDCMSWVNNVEHRGERGPDGRAVPRECKHTRHAMGQMRTRGTKAGRIVQPVGPWFEELQEYVASLVEYARNGTLAPEKLAAFHADYGRFEEKARELNDSASAVQTMLGLYKDLLRQISAQISET